MQILPYLSAILIAYLLGSIPTGYLLVRARGNVNLLQQGSGKTGATNVLRALGWRAAITVFTGDLAKGAIAVIVARLLTHGDPFGDLLAGFTVIAGHNYSMFLGFRGGRGIAPGAGTLLVIAPLPVLVGTTLLAIVIARTRYVSLGSVVAVSVVSPIILVMVLFAGQPPMHLLYALVGSAFVIASHRDNIRRLLRGTERKLGEGLK